MHAYRREVTVNRDGEVLILGAGFSRAVSPHLPVAADLGRRVRTRLVRSERALFRGSPRFSTTYPFEVWLSLLAEEQPHLREAENLTNASRFASMKDAIVAVLTSAQDQALAVDPPSWLYKLLLLLHHRRNNVISLNYDTLVEVGVRSLFGAQGGIHVELDTGDVLGGQPPLVNPPAGTWRAAETMRLLKLHGSLDWWWAPNDASGATLVRQEAGSVFGHPRAIGDDQRRREIPGREPFIIPPLATKSRYYRNPLTRQLWHDAYEALAGAERITLVGYSLPRADTIMSEMLGSVLRSGRATVEVVDLRPDAICKRLEALVGPTRKSGRLTLVGGHKCVETYVHKLAARASAQVVEGLQKVVLPGGRSYPDPVSVEWRYHGQAAVRGISSIKGGPGGTVTLVCHGDHLRSVEMGGQVSAFEVLESVRAAQRLFAEAADGHQATVIAYSTDSFNDPNAHHVLRLIADGQLPPAT